MIYEDFGYPSLLQYVPDAVERNSVKEALDLHSQALVSFIVERPHFHKRLCVIGSGFFVFSHDPTVVKLLTAAHVFDGFEKAGFGWITIGEQMIELRNVKRKATQSGMDVAIIEIDSAYLIACGLAGLFALPLQTSEELDALFLPTCSFAIFGYPHTKNRDIDMRDVGDRERRILGIALHGYAMDGSTGELCFKYDGRSMPEAWARHITSGPALDGMSGGPCVRFVVHRELKQPAIVVAGVFTRWVRRQELRAVAMDSPWLPS